MAILRVPLFHGLDEFGRAPGPSQSALVGGVRTGAAFFEERFAHLGLHALGAERKSEFAPVAIGQHGMVQPEGW